MKKAQYKKISRHTVIQYHWIDYYKNEKRNTNKITRQALKKELRNYEC